MKKTLSGLMALLLLLSVCAGCGKAGPEEQPDQSQDPGSIFTTLTDLDMQETVLEMDGNTVPADMYLYWLMYTCNGLEYQLNMFSAAYGMYTDAVDENGKVKWDQSVEGTPLTQMAREQAENNALSYTLMENVAAAHGVALTDEDKAAMDEELAQMVEQAGGEEAFSQSLYETGLSQATHSRLSASNYLYQHLLELAQDPSSDIYKAPSEDNAYVDHILLATKNAETNEPLSEDEIAEKKALAEDLLSQLQASSDLENLFTEFANTHGEDPGRESGAGYLINPNTNFVQEFKDAAFQLKPGEISGIVESDYGYHILLRKELTSEHLASLATTNLTDYLNEKMEAAMEGVVRSEKLDSMDIGSLYTGYVDALQALHPEQNPDAGDTGDAGSTDGTGDTSSTGSAENSDAAPGSTGDAAE